MRKGPVAFVAAIFLLAPGCQPYSQDEVSIRVNDEVTLAGTLSIPEGQGPFPAVVLLSGSGLQTRDHEVWGFPLFSKIADQLTRRSIVVLRCDDRGYGWSTGDPSGNANTTLDFADDAMAQVKYLQTRPEVNPARIGLLGISEGALVASMAAARSGDIEFVILLAGPAVPIDENLLAHLELNLRAKGLDEATIAKKVDLWRRIYGAVRRDEGLEQLRLELRDADERIPKSLDVVTSKWGRFLVSSDPRDDQAKMKARVLALYGEKDVQVPAGLNAPALKQTFREVGKTNYEVQVLDDANHLFQKAVTGSADEYEELPKEFVPGFTEAVAAWILSLTSPVNTRSETCRPVPGSS
jgi:pimeloyl-ACP methyl ester carboxylesterase